MIPSDADWVGLTLATESNRATERPYLCWVIRNRIRSPRFPATARDVVLQSKQFSHFNPFQPLIQAGELDDEQLFDRIVAGDAPGLRLREIPPSSIAGGRQLAAVLLRLSDDFAPFGPEVLHYWSPVSMIPAGRAPSWAAAARRTFTPEGIDPNRFIFAEGVP